MFSVTVSDSNTFFHPAGIFQGFILSVSHLNPFNLGMELFKLKAGKKTQSLTASGFPSESNTEDSSKMYRYVDLSEPTLISTT